MRRLLTGFVFSVLASVALLGVLVVFFLPTSTWLDQRAEAAELETALTRLTAEKALLSEDITRMTTDAEIERIARRDFNLVFPGEEAFGLLPAPPTPIEIPPSWPLSILHGETLD